MGSRWTAGAIHFVIKIKQLLLYILPTHPPPYCATCKQHSFLLNIDIKKGDGAAAVRHSFVFTLQRRD